MAGEETSDIDDNELGPRLGLALSGGGYRSALFGVGVLFYLAESEKISRLDTIASVSGGSYTNAMAHLYAGDLRSASDGDIVEHFSSFVKAMQKPTPWRIYGIPVGAITFAAVVLFLTKPSSVLLILAVVVLLFGLVVFVPHIGRIYAREIWGRLFDDVPRDRPLGPIESRLVVEVSPKGKRLDGTKRTTRAANLTTRADEETEAPSVHHVFCATDINYRLFMYFTNEMVCHRRLGRGSSGDYTLKQAVDASAALPPVFAPVVVSTEGFLAAPQDAPGYILCVDGGVHDTLATEWFRPGEWSPIERRRIGKGLWGGGIVLVVNGSAPPMDLRRLSGHLVGRFRMPIRWWASAHRRSLRLAFSNWDARNYRQLSIDEDDGFYGISVAENPFYGPEDTREVGIEQRAILAAKPVNWRELVQTSEKVSAIPRRLNRDEVLNLMYHGYVLAWRVLADPEGPYGTVIEALNGDTRTVDGLCSLKEFEDKWFGEKQKDNS